MSCKNKCCWWPHNWFCLKGLYWTFVGFFYLAIAYTLYGVYQIVSSPMLSGSLFWGSLFSFLIMQFCIVVGLATLAAVLKALRKIVHAVAPCCCHEEKKEEVPAQTQETK